MTNLIKETRFSNLLINHAGPLTLKKVESLAEEYQGETFKNVGLEIFGGLVENCIFISHANGTFELNQAKFS